MTDTIPTYPYPTRWYKQSSQGLYGGARIQFGNNVTGKYEIKTRRKWHVNVKNKRLWSKALGQYVKLKVTTRVMRTIDKLGGLDEYLLGEKEARIKELGETGWWLRWAIIQTDVVKERFAREREALGLPPEVHQEAENVAKEPVPDVGSEALATSQTEPSARHTEAEVAQAEGVEEGVDQRLVAETEGLQGLQKAKYDGVDDTHEIVGETKKEYEDVGRLQKARRKGVGRRQKASTGVNWMASIPSTARLLKFRVNSGKYILLTSGGWRVVRGGLENVLARLRSQKLDETRRSWVSGLEPELERKLQGRDRRPLRRIRKWLEEVKVPTTGIHQQHNSEVISEVLGGREEVQISQPTETSEERRIDQSPKRKNVKSRSLSDGEKARMLEVAEKLLEKRRMESLGKSKRSFFSKRFAELHGRRGVQVLKQRAKLIQVRKY